MRNIVMTAMALSAFSFPAFAQVAAPATEPRFTTVEDSNLLSSRLVDLDVTNAAEKTIGQIKDIVFAADGQVKGYILSVGGFLGMGEHYVVVDPASLAVSFDTAREKWRATMNTTEDQLKAAPAFKYEGKWKS